jgi:nucleotide-binding universal stress UspA family protein
MSEMEVPGSGRIVVGVDGSPASRTALAWALNEGRLRQAAVEAVHAWQFPTLALSQFGGEAVPVFGSEDIEKAADKLLRETIKDVAGDDCDVAITATLASGHPADVLLAISEHADLLVVGSRGHGGFAGMLLGSVSNHVVHHAHCPVVVIRA